MEVTDLDDLSECREESRMLMQMVLFTGIENAKEVRGVFSFRYMSPRYLWGYPRGRCRKQIWS